MFGREKLIQKVEKTLKERKFNVCRYENLCLDLAAKQESCLLLLKILFNIDSIQKDQALGLRVLSSILNARSYIVGKITRTEFLKDGIVYERFEIPAVTPKTLEMILDEKYPILRRDRGGLFVTIDPIKLRNARKKKRLSRAKLARLVGTTKKNIYDHERREFRASIELVHRLENILGETIRKISIQTDSNLPEIYPKNRMEERAVRLFRKIGFWATTLRKAPPDVAIKGHFLAFVGIVETEKEIKKRIETLKNFSEFVDEPAFVVVPDKVDHELDVPVVNLKLLENEAERPEDLKKIIFS